MTESFRRSGAYEYPQGDGTQGTTTAPPSAYPQQQHSASTVNPEWPPPPAYGPAEPVASASVVSAPAVASEPFSSGWPGRPAPAATVGHDTTTGHGGSDDGTVGFSGSGSPGDGTTGHSGSTGHGGSGDGTAVFPAPPAADGVPRKRTRGPIALLAAVAFVAAAVGGGTAYAFQELTDKNPVAVSSTSTSVMPSSKKGSISAIAAAVSPSVVEVTATLSNGTSTGSGVIITSGGEIVTNNHVVSGASSIKVKTSDGKSYTAEVVGTDSKKDLALVKAQGASGLKAATLGDSSGVQVGDEVVAIGSPEGLTGTVTSGIVSALNRDVTVSTDENQGQNQGGDGNWPFQFGGQQFNGDTGSSTTTYKAIQTDASLNPGNSGGALIDMNGNIVGINSAMYSSGSSSSSSSDAGSVGLGFAIPINTVKSDLATLRSGSTS